MRTVGRATWAGWMALVGLIGAVSTAAAQPVALVCVLNGDPSSQSTYYIDMAARTVTTDAHSPPSNRHMQTFAAEITDTTIRYAVGPTFVTIDRYSLVMRNPLYSFQCHKVQGPQL